VGYNPVRGEISLEPTDCISMDAKISKGKYIWISLHLFAVFPSFFQFFLTPNSALGIYNSKNSQCAAQFQIRHRKALILGYIIAIFTYIWTYNMPESFYE
jgi:hypothetical protein